MASAWTLLGPIFLESSFFFTFRNRAGLYISLGLVLGRVSLLIRIFVYRGHEGWTDDPNRTINAYDFLASVTALLDTMYKQ